MKIESLKAEKREAGGSRVARRLRDEGKVPAILYGHAQEVLAMAVPAEEVMRFLQSGHHLVTLQLADREERALVKEVQFDTWGREILHVDFSRVGLDELVHVTVEIVAHGTPKGLASGAVLEQPLRKLEIACRADAIPDQIRVEVADMETGARLHVSELKLPEGAKAVTAPETIVFLVQETREEVTAVAAEAAVAEPELIKRPPKAEEAAGEEKK